MNEVLVKYLSLLLEQMQGDAQTLSTPWVYLTVVPFILYFLVCLLKWMILLAPVTIPVMLFRWSTTTIERGTAKLDKWLKRN